MPNKIKTKVVIDASLERSAGMVEKFLMQSNWEWEHWRDCELIDKWTEHNLTTDEGVTSALGVQFAGVTQITDWFVLIYNTDTTPALTMTYATPAFTESTHYSEATRPAWQSGAVVSKNITNSANKASFTMSTAETIYGAALIGGGSAADTKNDKAGGGFLYCVSDFSGGSKTVASSDILKVTISITGQDL